MNRIKEVLNEKGVTQTELASRLTLTKASITQLLTIGNPNLKTLESIAVALNVPVWELLASREQMKVEFSPTVYGLVMVNGKPHTIQSVDDLMKICGSINQPKADIQALFDERLKLFSNPSDVENLKVCLDKFGAEDTLAMLDICDNNTNMAMSVLMRAKK